MGKGEKTGLGRLLVKHHNQMIQQSKEKGTYYRSQQKKVLESVTEVNDIDAVIEQTDEAHSLFSSINLDLTSSADIEISPEERREQQKKEEALHASSLRIPRRPPWNAKMSVEELDANEKRAFLEWRRILARLEENEKLVLTPFEKNLDIWRQLWRVLERSDLKKPCDQEHVFFSTIPEGSERKSSTKGGGLKAEVFCDVYQNQWHARDAVSALLNIENGARLLPRESVVSDPPLMGGGRAYLRNLLLPSPLLPVLWD